MKKTFNFKNIQFFKLLNQNTINNLERCAVRKVVPKGRIIYKEDVLPSGLYVLEQGQVSVFKSLKDGTKVQLHTIVSNNLFGEVSLIANTPYNDYAITDKDSIYYFIKKEDFFRVVHQDTDAALALSVSLSQKLAEVRQKIIQEKNKVTIAVFYNEGDLKDKAWLAMETALSLKEQTKKNVLLVDLQTHPQDLEKILMQKFEYDFILINLQHKKDAVSAAMIMQCNFLINLSKKKLEFFKKLYHEDIRIVDVNLANERRLDRVEWFVGHLARVIAKRTVGLALGAGSVGGIAEIGAIKYLLEQKIPIDMISGCSAGALYGSFFAHNANFNVMEKTIKKYAFTKRIFDFAFSMKGFAKGDILKTAADKVFGNRQRIEDFKIPIRIVSTNISKQKIHIFDKGLIWPALRSSFAIPIVFTPHRINKEHFIDGNVSEPLPVDILRKEKIDKVIAIYATPIGDKKNKKLRNVIDIYLTSRAMTNDSLALKAGKNADLFIKIDVSNFGFFEHSKFYELIRLGYNSAKNSLLGSGYTVF